MSDKSPLVVPHAALAAEPMQRALPQLRLPKLQALLQRLSPGPVDVDTDESLSPPHERALARAFGLPVADGLIPFAAHAALARGLAGHAPGWAFVTPCHWQVGMGEVRQDPPAQLALTPQESLALMDAMRPYFVEDGLTLHEGGDPAAWLAHGAPLAGLPTASLDRVIGRNIEAWNLGGDAARPLRRLQQEMQMLLYTLPLNDAREQRGLPPVNSFWVSGTGDLPAGLPPAPTPGPSHLNSLTQAAQNQDPAAWLAAWHEIDERVMAALLAASQAGAAVTLTLCGERACQTWHSRPLGLAETIKRRLRPVNALTVLEAL